MKFIPVFLWLFVCGVMSGCALPGALTIPEDFVAADELDVVSLTRQALKDAGRGRYADAELALHQARSLDPGNRQLDLNLAIVLERQGRFSEARVIFKKLLETNPEYIPALSGLARLYVSKEDYSKAREQYLVLVDLLESTPLDEVQVWQLQQLTRTYRSLSALEFRVGEEEASACYSELAVRVTANATPDEKIRHSRTLIAVGRFEDAKEYLQTNIDRGKPFELVHQLALVHYGLGEKEEAYTLCADLLDTPALPPESESDCLWVTYLERELAPRESSLEELTTEELEELAEEEQKEWDEKLPRLALAENALRLYLPDSFVEEILAEEGTLLDL